MWLPVSFLLCAINSPRGYEFDVTEEHPKVLQTAIKHCIQWNKYAEMTINAKHTEQAFNEAKQFVDDFYSSTHSPSITNTHTTSKEVILDSGCGVGLSSIKLALAYPNTPVIGIDKSTHRLSKNKYTQQEDDCPSNLLLLRAELVDFWLLAATTNDWHVSRHYILYPNPYPKSKHLQRRWHGIRYSVS